MPHPTAMPRQRRAAALAATLVVIVLASVSAGLLLNLSSANYKATFRARHTQDTTRIARNALEHLCAQIQARWDQPGAGYPDEDSAKITLLNNKQLDAATLGVDTDRYTLISVSTSEDTTYVKPDGTKHTGLKPFSSYALYTVDKIAGHNLGDPGKGSAFNRTYSLPLVATVRLRPKLGGPDIEATARGVLQKRYGTQLQFGLYFNKISPSLWGGAWTYKGGIHANSPAYFYSTWNASSGSMPSAITIESVSAPYVFFGRSPMENGVKFAPGETPYKVFTGSSAGGPGTKSLSDVGQHIFISRGDINKDGTLTPWDGTNLDVIGGKPATEYRSANYTLMDYYGRKLPSGLTTPLSYYRTPDWRVDHSDSGSYLYTTAGNEGHTTIIDSANPNFMSLSSGFAGNLQDKNRGWQEILPYGLSQYGDPRSFIEPPAEFTAPTVPKPATEAENPEAWRQWKAYESEGKEQFLVNKSAKPANQANLYVYVETPAKAGDSPRVTVFTPDPSKTVTDALTGKTRPMSAAEIAKAYQTAIAGGADRDKLIYEDFSQSVVHLPDGIIETSRAFYDRSQSSGDNSMENPRVKVSAIDIDMGKLREAIAPGSATIVKKTRSLKDPSDPAAGYAISENKWDLDGKDAAGNNTGWNGIVYTQVDNPRSMGWSGAATWNSSLGAGTTTNLNAIRVHNAQKLPDRTENADGTGYAGTAGNQEGFSFATNAPLYTVGSINADGDPKTDIANGTTSGAANYVDAAGVTKTDVTLEQNKVAPTGAPVKSHHLPVTFFADSITWMPAAHANPDNVPGTYDLALGDAKVNATGASNYGYSAGTNVFMEFNYSYIGGGAEPTSKYLNARALNFFAGSYNLGSRQRVRGSLNMLFQSKYNRKFFNSSATNTLAFDFGYDPNLKSGFTSPGTPYAQSYQLVGAAESFKTVSD